MISKRGLIFFILLIFFIPFVNSGILTLDPCAVTPPERVTHLYGGTLAYQYIDANLGPNACNTADRCFRIYNSDSQSNQGSLIKECCGNPFPSDCKVDLTAFRFYLIKETEDIRYDVLCASGLTQIGEYDKSISEICASPSCDKIYCDSEIATVDYDGDGHAIESKWGGDDCDDYNRFKYPGNVESCNGVDDNCNGQIDESLTQSCGNCGTQTCSAGAWIACTGQGVCSPGTTETKSCGNCGTQTRTCNSGCAWDSWTACTGQGVCSPGTVQACNDCGTKTCTSSCQFNSCTGDSLTQSCGKCGTKSCSLEGNWTGCIEGACEIVFAYLSDMTEAPTNKADNLDKVKIITLSEELLIGKTINVEIYKSNTLFGLGILDWLIPDNLVDNLTKTVDSQGKAVIEWTVPDVNDTTYYYAYSHVDPYSSKASWYLEVSPIESNSPPSVVISSPNYNLPENYNFNVNEVITFTQSSSDIDSSITNYSWDFDGGAPATSTSQNASVTYSTPGSKYISLKVTDDRGAVSTSNVGIMIDDPLTNQPPLAIITSPESGKTYSRKITVDARKSIDDRTPFEQLLFTWYFDNVKDPEHSNVSGTAGAYFDKVFDTAGLHSVAVMIDDGE